MFTSSREVPLEVVEEITSYLRLEPSNYCISDKNDLRACSLVSKTWCAASRPQLFQEVAYTFGTRAKDSRTTKLSDFIAFLQEHVHISLWLRELRLTQRLEVERPDEHYDAHIGLFNELLLHIPNLRRLRLIDIPIVPLPEPHPPLAHSIPLDELHINYTDKFRYDPKTRGELHLDLPAVLRMFHSTRKLFLTCVPWDSVIDPSTSNGDTSTVPLHFPELGICGPDREVERFHSILPQLIDLSSIIVLTFVSDTWTQHAPLLRQFNPYLEELYLPPVNWWDWMGTFLISRRYHRSTYLIAFQHTTEQTVSSPASAN